MPPAASTLDSNNPGFLAGILAASIEPSILQAAVPQTEALETASLVAELEAARIIQQSMLPSNLPTIAGVNVAGFCCSARQVGGDFSDVFKLGEHSLLLAVADVMGKGVPDALFASTLKMLLRSLAQWTESPASMLSRLNEAVFDDLARVEMFITAQITLVDLRGMTLTAASAGHQPILIADPGNHVQVIAPKGMPLGIARGCPYGELQVALSPASFALMYTDGVSELRNAQGDCFGQERLARWFSAAARDSNVDVSDLKEALLQELRNHQQGIALSDDQTFLLLSTRSSLTTSELPETNALAA